MECGKLTAKLRDAVPVCFMVDGKEVKRYKNIEIPDELKKLPYKAFDFNVPLTGAITFKISFEPGILPEVWPEPFPWHWFCRFLLWLHSRVLHLSPGRHRFSPWETEAGNI